MGRIMVAKASSVANMGTGVGSTNSKKQNIKIHGYSVASRGADFAADVQCDLYRGYSGLGANLLTHTGTEVLGAVIYTSNFTVNADGWVELTNGNLSFTGNVDVGGKTDTLKVAAVDDPDDASMKHATLCTSGKYYKVLLDVFAETGAGLDGSFLGLGANGDAWNEVYDHDSGKHQVITAENTWYTDVALYGKADSTNLEICVYTTKNGNTEDQIAVTKDLHFHNIRLYEVLNVADWVPSAENDFGWDGEDQGFSSDAGAGGTLTHSGNAPAADDLFYVGGTIAEYVAQNVTITAFGAAAISSPAANGAFGTYVKADGTDTVILTADGTGDSDIGSLIVKKLNGCNTTNLVYHSTIQNGDVQDKMYTFPAPVWIGNTGWWMNFTTGGSSSILDVNVFYEIM